MPAYVALLRGINVGGNKTIPMATLKALCEGLGFEGVKTLLNSGNVVFAAKKNARGGLAKTIESAIAKEFGFQPAVMIRSPAELKAIIEGNPFPEMAKSDPSHLLVMTLAAKPHADAKTRIAMTHSGPEQIKILGENVYLTYPGGIGTTKLTNVFLEKQLGVIGTARNWNTVAKLVALASLLP